MSCQCPLCTNSHMPLFGGKYSYWRRWELVFAIQGLLCMLVYLLSFKRVVLWRGFGYREPWGDGPLDSFVIFFRGTIRSEKEFVEAKAKHAEWVEQKKDSPFALWFGGDS